MFLSQRTYGFKNKMGSICISVDNRFELPKKKPSVLPFWWKFGFVCLSISLLCDSQSPDATGKPARVSLFLSFPFSGSN